MEPEKPFACSVPDCGMSFTNEDHLHVHTKKHDMILQLGMGQKAAFVADQTPTPTRFIRNCEEVGLFQDLQNVTVNPFDEGFKRAMETKHGLLTLEGPSSNEDALHTPNLVFPLESGDCALYTTNNQRNITISRSSSDESGAVKEYETTKISKLTNEITTISRIVGKDDISIVKHETTTNKDSLNQNSVSYTNNVIIHSNVEIRHDINIDTKKLTNKADFVTKDPLSLEDFEKLTDNTKINTILPPIMSQKSLDYVVDSLTTDVVQRDDIVTKNVKRKLIKNVKNQSKDNGKRNSDNPHKIAQVRSKTTPKIAEEYDYVVTVKRPGGKHAGTTAVDDAEKTPNAKDKLNTTLKNRIQNLTPKIHLNTPIVQSVVPISTGTLIPVTIMCPNLPANPNTSMNPTMMNPSMPFMQNTTHKIPIRQLPVMRNFKSVKRKNDSTDKNMPKDGNMCKNGKFNGSNGQSDNSGRSSKTDLDNRSAASKRYRERLKVSMQKQSEENKYLREMNRRLLEEKAALQMIVTQHLNGCPNKEDLSRMHFCF